MLLLRDTKHRRAALDSHGSTVSCCFHQRCNFFFSLSDGCLKYKSKEKSKTGGGHGPCLNYDVKIIPKASLRVVKKSGSIGLGLKCRALVSVVEPQGDFQSRGDFFFPRTAGRTGATSDFF